MGPPMPLPWSLLPTKTKHEGKCHITYSHDSNRKELVLFIKRLIREKNTGNLPRDGIVIHVNFDDLKKKSSIRFKACFTDEDGQFITMTPPIHDSDGLTARVVFKLHAWSRLFEHLELTIYVSQNSVQRETFMIPALSVIKSNDSGINMMDDGNQNHEPSPVDTAMQLRSHDAIAESDPRKYVKVSPNLSRPNNSQIILDVCMEPQNDFPDSGTERPKQLPIEEHVGCGKDPSPIHILVQNTRGSNKAWQTEQTSRIVCLSAFGPNFSERKCEEIVFEQACHGREGDTLDITLEVFQGNKQNKLTFYVPPPGKMGEESMRQMILSVDNSGKQESHGPNHPGAAVLAIQRGNGTDGTRDESLPSTAEAPSAEGSNPRHLPEQVTNGNPLTDGACKLNED